MFSDATESDINIVLCYVLSQYLPFCAYVYFFNPSISNVRIIARNAAYNLSFVFASLRQNLNGDFCSFYVTKVCSMLFLPFSFILPVFQRFSFEVADNAKLVIVHQQRSCLYICQKFPIMYFRNSCSKKLTSKGIRLYLP
jgi:hypothetical protein